MKTHSHITGEIKSRIRVVKDLRIRSKNEPQRLNIEVKTSMKD